MIFIEIGIIVIFLIQMWFGFRRGFLVQILDLAGILISFLLALHFYLTASGILESWHLNANLAKPTAFFVLWILFQIIFYLISILILRLIPPSINNNLFNRVLGILPGFFKGALIVAIILTIFYIIPFSAAFKENLTKYPLSRFFIKFSAQTEAQMEKVFSGLNDLNFFGTVQNEEGTTYLNFKTERYALDEGSEETMLDLVNADRAKAGLAPLQYDAKITAVARAHSIDMAKNGYFSHVDLAGKTPADRMQDGQVNYWVAGENIALAPSAQLAEIGFMNSPKHRDNILDPNYGRIGIGIIDLGVYGKMVTQNFAN